MVETKETIQETAKLVRRAQGGDEEALEAFLREIQPGIFRRSLRLLGNQADAEDMTQDILIKVLENLPDLRDPMAAPAWVKRIVETSCINGMRKTKDYVFEDEEQSGAVFDNLVEETVDALPLGVHGHVRQAEDHYPNDRRAAGKAEKCGVPLRPDRPVWRAHGVVVR